MRRWLTVWCRSYPGWAAWTPYPVHQAAVAYQHAALVDPADVAPFAVDGLAVIHRQSCCGRPAYSKKTSRSVGQASATMEAA